MIKLKFKILSWYIDKNNVQKFKQYQISEEFSDNLIFSVVLKYLYDKYGINNRKEYHYNIFNVNELFWKQYFSNSIICDLNYSLNDYEKLTLNKLEKQFSVSKIEILVHLNCEAKGKTVGSKLGIDFFFHFNEKDLHHKPHIHCSYSGIETRIEIKTLKILDKPFKSSKMKYALKVVKDNQYELINYWNKAIVNGEPLEFHLNL